MHCNETAKKSKTKKKTPIKINSDKKCIIFK